MSGHAYVFRMEDGMRTVYGNVLVGQSGGPTAAINATLAGVIRGVFAAEKKGLVGKLYGMRHGIEGCLEGKLVDLTERFRRNGNPESELKLLETTPAAALGSCRTKLPDPEKDPAVFEDLARIFEEYQIRTFFYIGGNDSMDTVAKLERYFARHDYEIRIVGVPKTIDNDLCGTDHTPGYGSAAKYVAATVREMICDTSVYTVRSVTIAEIMGRDAGWLTAASACAGFGDGTAPDLICLPERVFDTEKFLERIRRAWETHPNVMVAVSEGVRFADGTYVGAGCQNGVRDNFGHQYLSGTGKVLEALCRERLGCKVRSVELNIPQRCAGHLASACDLRESSAIGRLAVMAAIRGQSGVMASFRRTSDKPYRIRLETVPVSLVATKVRTVPDEYISEDGFGVTEAFLDYVRPLITGEARALFRDGVPTHFRL